MVLKITPKQQKEINALVRKACCNCCKGNCLLLDDGEETKCVQLISRYGIYCNYFLKAVLPAEKGTPYCLCRTDDRRGGLCGVRRQRLSGGY